MRNIEGRYQALISQFLQLRLPKRFNNPGTCNSTKNNFMQLRSILTSTDNNRDIPSKQADLHDQFLNHFTEDPRETGEQPPSHSTSMRSTKPLATAKRTSRFGQGNLTEGDMYSGKPVWQQLNELESTWNMHLRHKSRIQSRKAITKAKKCLESLDAIEANQSTLVNVDTFREVLQQRNREQNLSDDGDRKISRDGTDLPRSPGDGHVNAPLRITSSMRRNTPPKWRVRPNNSDVTENQDTNRTIASIPEANVFEQDLATTPTENATSANVAPQELAGHPLNEEERAVLRNILGDQQEALIDAATPAAVIEATTRLEPETWLNMNPAHIVLQQSILKCKSTSQLLVAIEGKIDQMSHVNVSTALHRLAKYSNPTSRYMLNNNEVFNQLIAAVERHIGEFDCQGLANVFWSLVRLRIQPAWLNTLMEALSKHSSDLAPKELASCLFAVSKISSKTPTAVDLRDCLIGHAQERACQFTLPLDLTCLATALARLNVRNPILFGSISSNVMKSMDEFNMQHVCGIAWAFASLGFTDRALFLKIRKFVEEHATTSSIRDVVHLAWALSKIGEADDELFLGTISPLVRSHIGCLSCRDISTVAWAYVNAEIDDEDLFEDLASALEHHVEEMTTQDIAAAVAAFSHMEQSHKQLFKKMRNRAYALAQEFTPLQLSKIVRGFSSVADDRFYAQMAKVVESKMDKMLPENMVEILMGFSEVGYKSNTLYKKLLDGLAHGARKMYAEDALLLLQVITKLDQDPNDHVMSNTVFKVSHALIEQIEKRVGRWKCYDISHMTSFFCCLSRMGIGGSKGDSTVRTLCKQLASCMNRLLKSNLDADYKKQLFVNFIHACAELPPRKLALVQAELSKNTQLMTAMHNGLASLRSGTFLESTTAKVDVAYSLVRLGYQDEAVVDLCDEIVTSSLWHQQDYAGTPDQMETLSRAIWLLTESNLHVSWVKDQLSKLAPRTDESEPSEASDALIRLMWPCVVFGDDVLLIQMVDRFVPLFVKLPKDMLMAQQIALHVLRFLPLHVQDATNKNNAAVSPNLALANAKVEPFEIPGSVYSTLQEWLEYQRDDLYTLTPGSKRKRALELDYDSVISESLIAMRIPHRTVHTIENIYRVSAAFPIENHLIDVLNFTDCFVPNGQPRASALLRQRQLQLLGYGLASMKLSSIYESSREKRCKELMAETISGFCATAIDYLPPGHQLQS